MTTRARATQAEIKRAILAAREAGLVVSGVSIAPDGTLTVHGGETPGLVPNAVNAQGWEGIHADD